MDTYDHDIIIIKIFSLNITAGLAKIFWFFLKLKSILVFGFYFFFFFDFKAEYNFSSIIDLIDN